MYGGQQPKRGLMIEDDDDEDLYEGFNYAISFDPPPQTASSNAYQTAAFGGGAARGGAGGYGNPPGTAFR